MEYRYAEEIKLPVIGFLHESPGSLAADLVEQSDDGREKLVSFQDHIRSARLCKFWSNPADLGAKVSRSITQLMRQHPAVGWIRADQIVQAEANSEILALRRENDTMKQKLEVLSTETPVGSERFAQGKESFAFDVSFVRKRKFTEKGFWTKVADAWTSLELSWDDIFRFLGPKLLNSRSDGQIENHFSELAKGELQDVLAREYPDERFYDFSISSDLFDTILIQLRALKLIDEEDGFWMLTPYGDRYMTQLIAAPTSAGTVDDDE